MWRGLGAASGGEGWPWAAFLDAGTGTKPGAQQPVKDAGALPLGQKRSV